LGGYGKTLSYPKHIAPINSTLVTEWCNFSKTLVEQHVGEPKRQATTERVKIITYTACNLWKEMCRRVFDNRALNPNQLSLAIKRFIDQLQLAINVPA